jgi:hypothetical protein
MIRRGCSAVAILAVVTASLARAQRGPTSSAAPARVLTRDRANQRDWTLHAEVRVHPFQSRLFGTNQALATPFFELDHLKFLYPVPLAGAMHDAYPDRIKGTLHADNRLLDREHVLREGYQSITAIAAWEANTFRAQSIIFIGEFPVTTYETRIDEAAARRIDWTVAPWSAEMALCLEPQLFVESNQPIIRDLVKRWRDKHPPGTRPYDLAKRLAADTIAHMRITDPPLASQGRGTALQGGAHTAFVEGFVVHGAAHAAAKKLGSAYDLACLLAAAYRAAGLPARLVIGFDVKKSDELKGIVIRSWVEFFLAREPKPIPDAEAAVTSGDGEWIPVDITRQQEFSSRAPPQNQRWEFFGHNEEFDFVVPIGYHWIPPEDAINTGPPALWGWQPTPVNPAGDAEIKFWAFETPKRGGEKKPTPR